MSSALSCYYGFAVANVVFGAAAIWLRNSRIDYPVWFGLTALWVGQLMSHFAEAGVYSLSGVAPTCAIAAIVLCLCQCWALKQDVGTWRPVFSGGWLVLLAVASFFLEESSHDSFMMSYIFAILFFLSRPLSLGCVLFSLSGMLGMLRGNSDSRIFHTSKSAAFMATILFLGGEIVGCYWGFMGWGTTWRWSGNFLFSAMLFVLFMVSFHIPRSLFSTRKSYNIAFSTPLVLVALCMVLTKIM